jgi:acyl carrier protein
VNIKEILREYIHTHYLNDDNKQGLKYDTPLLSSGIIDSIGVMKLINFIESTFRIEFLPRELDRDSLETIDKIHLSILRKTGSSGL